MSVVRGFGGMRAKEDQLLFDPFIPDQWKSYSFRVEYRGRVIMLRVSKDKVETILESGEPLDIHLKGELIHLA
jgi:maltose phosphorylase